MFKVEFENRTVNVTESLLVTRLTINFIVELRSRVAVDFLYRFCYLLFRALEIWLKSPPVTWNLLIIRLWLSTYIHINGLCGEESIIDDNFHTLWEKFYHYGGFCVWTKRRPTLVINYLSVRTSPRWTAHSCWIHNSYGHVVTWIPS